MTERGEWLAPAALDRVTITVDYQRTVPGNRVSLYMAGHSQKRLAPLWTWEVKDEAPENIESVVGGILGAVTYYGPTDPTKFLRACVGGSVDGPDADPLPLD